MLGTLVFFPHDYLLHSSPSVSAGQGGGVALTGRHKHCLLLSEMEVTASEGLRTKAWLLTQVDCWLFVAALN